MRVDSIETCPAWAWTASSSMPGLAQPGQAGVAQLMARPPLQPGPTAGAGEDLVDPFGVSGWPRSGPST